MYVSSTDRAFRTGDYGRAGYDSSCCVVLLLLFFSGRIICRFLDSPAILTGKVSASDPLGHAVLLHSIIAAGGFT